MSMSEKTQRTGRTVNIAEKEQATQWLSSRPGYKPLLDNIIDFLNLHYRGSNKGWVNDGNAKFKFGPSNQNGRISIDPRPSKNGINVRFGVSVSNIPDYFRSKDLPQSLKPEICFNESRSYYDILLPLAGRNNEEFEAIKSFLKAGICEGFIYTQENDELYNEIQEQTSDEDKLTYVRSAISEKICKRKEQQMERKFVNWYKLNHPKSNITQQYSDIMDFP